MKWHGKWFIDTGVVGWLHIPALETIFCCNRMALSDLAQVFVCIFWCFFPLSIKISCWHRSKEFFIIFVYLYHTWKTLPWSLVFIPKQIMIILTFGHNVLVIWLLDFIKYFLLILSHKKNSLICLLSNFSVPWTFVHDALTLSEINCNQFRTDFFPLKWIFICRPPLQYQTYQWFLLTSFFGSILEQSPVLYGLQSNRQIYNNRQWKWRK